MAPPEVLARPSDGGQRVGGKLRRCEHEGKVRQHLRQLLQRLQEKRGCTWGTQRRMLAAHARSTEWSPLPADERATTGWLYGAETT